MTHLKSRLFFPVAVNSAPRYTYNRTGTGQSGFKLTMYHDVLARGRMNRRRSARDLFPADQEFFVLGVPFSHLFPQLFPVGAETKICDERQVIGCNESLSRSPDSGILQFQWRLIVAVVEGHHR